MDTPDDDLTSSTLAAIATLLEHAAEHVRATAERTGPRSPAYLIATELELMSLTAVEMAGPQYPEDRTCPLERDPRRLVQAAEQLTRLIEPQHQPPGLPALVIRLCDLAIDLAWAEP